MEPLRQPTPLSVTIYFLAVFHRAFAAIQEYAEQGDHQGLLLDSELSNALHNTPSCLYNYYANASAERSSHQPGFRQERINSFLERLNSKCCPARLIQHCRKIVSPENTAATLGLREDFADYDSPPPEIREIWRERLGDVCLSLRVMSGTGWDEEWTPEEERIIMYLGQFAAMYVEIPLMLVHWSQFDVAAYKTRVQSKASSFGERSPDYWERFFASGPRETAR